MTTTLPKSATTSLEMIQLTQKILQDNNLWNWRVTMKHLKSRFGYCNFRTKTIVLSHLLLHCTQDAIFDTITHEGAHAIVGIGHHHDNVWRAKHIELGGSGQRVGSDNNFIDGKETADKLRNTTSKYIVSCPNGHTHYRNKMSIMPVSCGKCSRRFDERYLLTYSINPEWRGR